MRNSVFGCLLGAGLALSTSAAAQTILSDVSIYNAGAWDVALITYDDGITACLATVSNARAQFNLWALSDNTVFLAINSPGLGEMAKTTPLYVKIDRRSEWLLTDIVAEGDDVSTDLPDSADSGYLIRELAVGRTLFITNNLGGVEETFSLSGSSRSIEVLSQCMKGIVR